jgi:hypothetical protein
MKYSRIKYNLNKSKIQIIILIKLISCILTQLELNNIKYLNINYKNIAELPKFLNCKIEQMSL